MTKAEEKKILEQIRGLVSGTDYLSMILNNTILNNAERSIDDDACYDVVGELDMERNRHIVDNERGGKALLKVEHERDCLADQLKQKDAEIQKLDHMLHARETECAKLESERDVMVECHDGLAEMVDKYEQEIMRLKAEVYDLRKWGEAPVVPGDNPLRTEGE